MNRWKRLIRWILGKSCPAYNDKGWRVFHAITRHEDTRYLVCSCCEGERYILTHPHDPPVLKF